MRLVSMALVFGSIGWSVACPALGAAEQSPLYRISKTVALGAPDGWDYLTFDARADRVYIAHGDRLTVVDGRTGAMVGTVDGMPGGTHGIAISPATRTGYTDDGRAGLAVAFDLESLKITDTIKADDDADGIIFDPASRHVFVIDGDPGKLTVIDPTTNTVIATVDGGGKLEFGVADGKGKLYVNGEARREVVRVDTSTNRADAHWAIPQCESPHGIAMDRKSRRLFVSCHNNMMVVVDAGDGHVVASLPIGAFTDGAAFDPVRKRAFSSNGEGSVTVISENSPDSYSVLGTVKTELGGRTMTIDPQSGRLYVVVADITVDESVPMSDFRHRYQVAPGSAKLLFLDPVERSAAAGAATRRSSSLAAAIR